jgi:hypothetical protein
MFSDVAMQISKLELERSNFLATTPVGAIAFPRLARAKRRSPCLVMLFHLDYYGVSGVSDYPFRYEAGYIHPPETENSQRVQRLTHVAHVRTSKTPRVRGLYL